MIYGDEMEHDRPHLAEKTRDRRDRFAAAALAGLLASCVEIELPKPDWAARRAYDYADAMLANEPPIASSSLCNPERAQESAPGAEGRA